MKIIGIILLLAAWITGASVQEPSHAESFLVGVYGDAERSVTCFSGPAGSTFEQVVWAWVPEDLGMAYLTLRFDFPDNLDMTRRPVFNEQISYMVFTDYPDGSQEWQMIFDGCPSGWVQVFSQECTLLDAQHVQIQVMAANSMLRDCSFVLNDVDVINQLELNDPACVEIPVQPSSWGSVRRMFR